MSLAKMKLKLKMLDAVLQLFRLTITKKKIDLHRKEKDS